MLKVGVLVSGGGTNLQAIMDRINDGTITDVQIVTVVSNRKNSYALERAKNNHIEAVCISPKDFETRQKFTLALRDYFIEKEVDLIIMAGYLVVVGEEFIKAFANRIMNIHPALIPSFCGDGFYGLKVHEAVLERGVKVTGATVHFVDEGTDTGPIIIQKAVQVKDDDTAQVLQKRVMEEAEWVIYPEAIQLYAQNKIKIVDNRVKIN